MRLNPISVIKVGYRPTYNYYDGTVIAVLTVVHVFQ